ncbi:MAG: heme NO-binding domain-containing protein [bacterium]
MYGLINKAVEGLVRSRFGDGAWARIRARAGLPDEPFVSMEQYPDKSTYDLVAAASVELGAPAEAILEEFGRYWTKYTAEAGYGELMRSAGSTLPEFLHNLDQLHTRVQLSFPHLAPPSFAVSHERSDGLDLKYHSARAGLAPLVVGLLRGLGERFDIDLEISFERVESARPHDLFHIQWKSKASGQSGSDAGSSSTNSAGLGGLAG